MNLKENQTKRSKGSVKKLELSSQKSWLLLFLFLEEVEGNGRFRQMVVKKEAQRKYIGRLEGK